MSNKHLEGVNETLWGQPFALRFLYCVATIISGVILFIGYWNLDPNNQAGKFVIGIAFLFLCLPFLIKFILPAYDFDQDLHTFLCLDREPEGITYYVLMDYLGHAATIAFGYTVAMYLKWKTTILDGSFQETVLALMVVLYVSLSAFSLIVLMYRIGWEKRKLQAISVLIVAFFIMSVFIEAGLAAVTSVKDV